MIIGIIGYIASGKSMLSDALTKKGFIKLSFSTEVRQEAVKRNIPIKREKLQDLGNLMRKDFGREYWAKRVLEKIEDGRNYVIEGFRNAAEVIIFKKRADFVLVGVDAPLEKRFQWIMLRGKDSDPSSLEEIRKIEARDRGKGEEEYGQQTAKCIELAEVYLMNDGSKEDFQKRINNLLKKLKIV